MFFDLRPSPFDEPSLARAKAYLNSKSSEEVEALALAAAQLDVAHRGYLDGANSKAEVKKKLGQCLALLEGFEERTFQDLVREGQDDRFQWEFSSQGQEGEAGSSTDLDPIFSLYETPSEGAFSSGAKAQWRWSEKLLYLFPCHVEAEAVRLAGNERELEEEFELPEGLPVVRRSNEPEPESPKERESPDLSLSLRIPQATLRSKLNPEEEVSELVDEPLRRLLDESPSPPAPPVSEDPLDLELDELLGTTGMRGFDQSSHKPLGRMGKEYKGDPLSRLLDDSPEEPPQLYPVYDEPTDHALPRARDPLEHLLEAIPEPVSPSGPSLEESVEEVGAADPLENLLRESPEEYSGGNLDPLLSEDAGPAPLGAFESVEPPAQAEGAQESFEHTRGATLEEQPPAPPASVAPPVATPPVASPLSEPTLAEVPLLDPPVEAAPVVSSPEPSLAEVPLAVPPFSEPTPAAESQAETSLAEGPLEGSPLVEPSPAASSPAEPSLAEGLLAAPILAEARQAEVPLAETRLADAPLAEGPLVEVPLAEAPPAESVLADPPEASPLQDEVLGVPLGAPLGESLAAPFEHNQEDGEGDGLLGQAGFEGIEFHQAIPVFRIFEQGKAREFYCDFLGFQVEWEHQSDEKSPVYIAIHRDGLTIHLTEHHGDCCPGSSVFVWMTELEQYYEELLQKEYPHFEATMEATPYAWFFETIDPFGNRIRFSQPLA